MSTERQTGKMPSATNTLSIDQLITGPRSEAFAQIRFHADRLAQLGNAIETLDAALMTLQSDNSASEQQALVDAARQLSTLLETAVTE